MAGAPAADFRVVQTEKTGAFADWAGVETEKAPMPAPETEWMAEKTWGQAGL